MFPINIQCKECDKKEVIIQFSLLLRTVTALIHSRSFLIINLKILQIVLLFR